ncbi:MAG: DUF2175 family protein [Candidatus Thermoplasmatota archaeon]|nr:DUF2175 family protein [Candidatus Thermoplasmatota archaeon]
MAEFKCFVCARPVKTGEKFTFTRDGSVHFDCFVSKRRQEVSPEKQEDLRILANILDSELQHLLNILALQNTPESVKEKVRVKYKDIEKAAGETTRMISEL